MNSKIKLKLTQKITQSFLRINIELYGKRTNRGYLTFFIQADDTTNVAELEDRCSTFFSIFLFATRTNSGKLFHNIT